MQENQGVQRMNKYVIINVKKKEKASDVSRETI